MIKKKITPLTSKQRELLNGIKSFDEISSELWIDLNTNNKSPDLANDIKKYLGS